MTNPHELELNLYIFILAGFLGYRIISRVPPLLHTPLMSATNALSGISLIGSMVVAGRMESTLSTILGCIAVACSSTNVVGGFLITDRMLGMFRTKSQATRQGRSAASWAVLIGIVVLFFASAAAAFLWKEKLQSYSEGVLRYLYIASAVLFVLGLQGLTSPRWARQGMILAGLGMLVAIIGTLFNHEIKSWGYVWITVGMVIGGAFGASLGLTIPMTAVPQRTAFSHSLGALAALMIGIAEYVLHLNPEHPEGLSSLYMTPLGFEVIIGALTFTGSLMAAAKLQELLPGAPMTYKGQNLISGLVLGCIVIGFLVLIFAPSMSFLFFLIVVMALAFGCLLVIPIGAADMPVVIALLNSYAGLADAAMGFVLLNRIQIITGSLDGTSGFLLSLLMCRAMNRSAMNVLFGAFGKPLPKSEKESEPKGTVSSILPEELAVMFEGARQVIIVPGYGMAVAQAQHAIGDLAKLLAKRGVEVKFAIHPVAGRMPGHMNVLLAEANIPYDQLYEMEQINPYFAEADIALVVGANDVTNPAARNDKSSPLYGMPILEVDRARSIIVMKRSMRPGFAGVDNDLYYNPKCMMLFGDAKESLNKLFTALKA
ncbi:MAG TPA: NAD(P)(+) transhydrogenase (Re/Si-specific) subunit beta [Gemmataceae bacterium]|jgi:NAD(P) transhydrogenase subunit beta|nr:NAD(P)(+) transhydrogenase (Re/Si-specific) subunit beta [Gemmataceae bacterium]